MSAARSVFVGDAARTIAQLPAASVDMVFTSPPYFRLRDYANTGQLGLEPTVDEWVDNLRTVARQLARVLTPTGTLWLNLGDSYSTHRSQGTARKSLLLGPERLALALTSDGWRLRSKLIWRKANPMPTSVTDRLACTWEVIYVLSRQDHYFFDVDAIREPHRTTQLRPASGGSARREQPWRASNAGSVTGLARLKAAGIVGHPLGKNPGDVWTIASSNYRGGHHATFPRALVERALRAGCPEARCTSCRRPWRRRTIRGLGSLAVRSALGPTCVCDAPREPGLVLDPFIGSGTTAVAAEALGRDWLGIELNPDLAREAERRIQAARAGPTTRRTA